MESLAIRLRLSERVRCSDKVTGPVRVPTLPRTICKMWALAFGSEDRLAELFEDLVYQTLKVVPGPRTRKDATDGSDLRVDFVYEDASPGPLALEVTTIPMGELKAAHAAGDKWSRSLDDRVKSERLGHWDLFLSAHIQVKDHLNEIIEVIQSAPDQAYRDPAGRFRLWRAQPESAGEEHGVQFMGVMTRGFAIEGFSQELLQTVMDNAEKLNEARPRQTHLIVQVGLSRSPDPTFTLVPSEPDALEVLSAVDWIWVVFSTGGEGMGDRPWAWWAQPGDYEWRFQIGPLNVSQG